MATRKDQFKITIELSRLERDYLTDLVNTGLYGLDLDEVVQRLLCNGFRDAITSKLIQFRK